MTQAQGVSATGLKGFLQWLQQDQPAVYAATASKIAKAVPKGFSGFNGSVLQNMRMSQGRRSMALRGYRLSGCCTVGTCGVSLAPVSSCAETIAPSVSNSCFGITDTSCAANSGATCNSTLTGVANIISAVSGAALNASQASAYDSLVNTQLSRAQQGLSPLTLTSPAAGVPTIAAGTTSASTILWVAAAAAGLFLLFARK
jgi:hypothetical protein